MCIWETIEGGLYCLCVLIEDSTIPFYFILSWTDNLKEKNLLSLFSLYFLHLVSFHFISICLESSDYVFSSFQRLGYVCEVIFLLMIHYVFVCLCLMIILLILVCFTFLKSVEGFIWFKFIGFSSCFLLFFLVCLVGFLSGNLWYVSMFNLDCLFQLVGFPKGGVMLPVLGSGSKVSRGFENL